MRTQGTGRGALQLLGLENQSFHLMLFSVDFLFHSVMVSGNQTKKRRKEKIENKKKVGLLWEVLQSAL